MRGQSRVLTRLAVAPALVGALVAGSLLGAGPAQAQKIKPDFWGMHDNSWVIGTRVPDVVGSANLTTSGTYWTTIEREPGVYDLPRIEAQVAAAEAVGAQPMIVLGRTPEHHSSAPAGAENFETYPPEPLSAWTNYVKAVATEFGDRLDYQIWPEPNIIQNWSGTPREMAELTAAASKVIRDVAPRATIVSPAVTLRQAAQREWMREYFRSQVDGRRLHTYVDAVAIDPFPLESGEPEDSYELMQYARKALASLDVRRPIWNNEINYGVIGGGTGGVDEYSAKKQQAFVIRTYVLSAAAKMARAYWLGWFRTETMAINMLTAEGTPSSAARAYGVVHSWLDGTQFRGCRETTRGKQDGLWTCTTKDRKGKNETRRIYWKPSGKKVKVRTHRTTRRYETQDGRSRRERGRTTLRIGKYPVMVVSKR